MNLQEASHSPLAQVAQDCSEPLVSCIIIFLNAAAFLVEAVESVLAQSYAQWELWLVDDGSADASTEIARCYAAQYRNIYYLEHEAHSNQGMSASRNLGVHHARGEFVAFLDADDVWLSSKLAEQVALLLAHPSAGMVYGRTQIWYSWQETPEARADFFYELGVTPNTLISPPRLFPVLMANRAQTPTTCNFMIRRETLAALGGFEDAFRGMYEDQAFYVKTHTHTPIYVADRLWARYRQHGDNSTKQSGRQLDYFEQRLTFLRWVKDYLMATQSQDETVQDETVWKALRHEMWRCQYPRITLAYEFWRRKVSIWISRGKGAFKWARHQL